MTRTALVTGANRGIGAQTARGLAEAGLRVVLGVREPSSAHEVLGSLSGDGHRIVGIDVADPAWVDRAVAEVRDLPVDVLVNNAGVLDEGDALHIEDGVLDREWAVNVRGPWSLIRALVPGMVERGYGRVVNVSSGGGSFGEGSMMAGHAAYAVTKAALNALTVVTAEIVTGDVKVNAVCPGWVRTRMGGDSAPRSVEEAADGIVWLATLAADGPHGGFFRDGEPIPW